VDGVGHLRPPPFTRGPIAAAGVTMTTTRVTAVAIGLAALWTTGLAAQTQETHTTTTTKIEIKGGKDVTVVGCLDRRSNGEFILTQARDNKHLDQSRYALVTDQDLSNRVGERVEIKGKAVTDNDGKVSVESKTRTEVENGSDQESKTKTTVEGTSGALALPFLGVRSVKTLSRSCN
jgi:hypothetical protein